MMRLPLNAVLPDSRELCILVNRALLSAAESGFTQTGPFTMIRESMSREIIHVVQFGFLVSRRTLRRPYHDNT